MGRAVRCGLSLALAWVAATAAHAATVTKSLAGTFAVTQGGWFQPEQAVNRNSNCASTIAASAIALTNYGFGLPAGNPALPADATITGIELTVGASVDGAAFTASVTLRTPAGNVTRSVAAANGPCGSGTGSLGGDGDLWGLTLDPSDLHATTFGVEVAGNSPNGVSPYRLDGVDIKVYFVPPPPAAPTGLAGASQQNRVRLSWTDASIDETSFRVERSPAAGNSFVEIGNTVANATSFDDTSAACDAAYDYRVRALRVGDGVYSAYSDAATVTHRCPDLRVVKASAGSPAVVGATWSWLLTLENVGDGAATFASGQSVLSDALPSASYGTVAVVPGPGATGNLSCGILSGVLSCAAAAGPVTLAPGAAFGIGVDGTRATPAELLNGASACSVDPGALLTEEDETNNACNTALVSVRLPAIHASDFEITAPPWGWSAAFPSP